MKKFNWLKILCVTAILFGSMVTALAQPDPPPNQFVENRPPNLVQALGLTQDQVRQLRQMNATLQPQLKESERAMRQARQALDEAIYNDEADESLIRERLQNFQTAQAEVAKNRTMMEVSVRKILNKEQLFKFRQLRQRFLKKQGKADQNPPTEKQRPNQRIQNPERIQNNPPRIPNPTIRPQQRRVGRPIN